MITFEALAPRHAIQFTKELGFTESTLEGNSKIVINAIRKGNIYHSTFGHLIKDILSCKVVIYHYIFVGFNSVPNLIVILFNLVYSMFHIKFICKSCV